MRLILIRHGQTSSNIDMLLDTAEPGADLTDLGIEQANAIPAALADVDIDLIVTSTLVRTQQTAAPLAAQRNLTPWIRQGVREISAGDLEMRGDLEALESYHGMLISWKDDFTTSKVNGETGQNVADRYNQVLEEIYQHVGEDGTAVVFSHGAVIRGWTAMFVRGVEFDYVVKNSLANTAAVDIVGKPGQWSLAHWGDRPLGVSEPLPATPIYENE
ncbi:histidine phosphatase family protein [Dermatophilus congolensis]|uniref:Alpha-ribazole phosphatase n=1 Tax=Dermatophilus congolensis TaxID=1863 RepID=A0A239VUR9_9MICO|nr:histidine phosphatase family protein [Dermatophilus congolensis]MBO3129967.1 histidine phosphatase family protein [Dermatophilus congolensis]MBO3131403.1 histidine phosphatase family protein [Dermatophilus congolensis]MBO3134441.1 histidine phosphatase family protein [Dermatophilus congolensis]MBO3136677.1 histidine phosphatase family protein [Dermatophilus congolensis]MBO3138921.1 histidine phosphatase family protein [Dermatophilus congolensis]